LRSHPEQTTSPPLMVRASPAPGRTAEGRAGALPTQPTPAGSAATRTWLSRGAAGTDGTRGLHCALGVRVRPSPARVRGREQKRAASPRPTPRGRGSCRAEGARAFQCARLADRRAVPPAASAALGLSENSAPARSRASVPCAPPPWNRTSPGAFRNRHYVARARTHSLSLSLSRTHTHTHTHTMPPRAAPTPARLLVSGRRARSSPSPSSGEGGSLPRGARETAGGGQREKGNREGLVRAQGRSWATQGAAGVAAKRGASLGGGCWAGRKSRRRVGPLSQPPERAGSGGGTRHTAARLRGPTPLSRPLTFLPRRLPHRGARGRLRAAGPPGSLFPSSSPSHVRAGSDFCPDFL